MTVNSNDQVYFLAYRIHVIWAPKNALHLEKFYQRIQIEDINLGIIIEKNCLISGQCWGLNLFIKILIIIIL